MQTFLREMMQLAANDKIRVSLEFGKFHKVLNFTSFRIYLKGFKDPLN